MCDILKKGGGCQMDCCKNCGASDLKLVKGYWCCGYCDSRFAATKEEQKTYSFSGTKSALGKHEGVNSQIGLDDDVARLLEKCRTDRKNARKYANLILDIDSDNEEALKYV
jgi:hypothetical protein